LQEVAEADEVGFGQLNGAALSISAWLERAAALAVGAAIEVIPGSRANASAPMPHGDFADIAFSRPLFVDVPI
jgi:hypothetical protein